MRDEAPRDAGLFEPSIPRVFAFYPSLIPHPPSHFQELYHRTSDEQPSMTRDVNRREFLGAASVAALALGLPVHDAIADETIRRWLPAPAPRPQAIPFDLHDVRLRPGIQQTGLETNRRFMMGLEPDRLLHMFRVTAGIPSSAQPLGGWEAPDNELRGHFKIG